MMLHGYFSTRKGLIVIVSVDSGEGFWDFVVREDEEGFGGRCTLTRKGDGDDRGRDNGRHSGGVGFRTVGEEK